MARLVVAEAKKRSTATVGGSSGSHRAGVQTEGEAAKRLLEANGYSPRTITPKNSQWEFLCPFHEDAGALDRKSSTNFYMNHKTSQYYCQSASCGEKGNLQTLEKYFGVSADPTLMSKFKSKDTVLKEYQSNLRPSHREFLAKDKGLRDIEIDRFRIGFDVKQDAYVIPYLVNRRPIAFRYYDPQKRGPNGSKYWWERAEGYGDNPGSIVMDPEADGVVRLFNPSDAAGDADGRVYICEGEFKAMLLTRHGLAAVSIPGASGFKAEWAQYFMKAKDVVVIMDNDNLLFHKHGPCHRCSTTEKDDCSGHNPGQEAAAKIRDFFAHRAKNVVLPLPEETARKTDINEYLMRDGHTFLEFQELVDGKGNNKYLVRTLGEVRADPPPETVFLVGEGLLPKGGRLLVTGAPKVGKAQTLTTPVCTPDGWRLMGDIKPGDMVTGSAGKPVTVTHVWPQGELPVYRVTMNDGSSTRACADHLWSVRLRGKAAQPGTVDTIEAKRLVEAGTSVFIPLTQPVEYAYQEFLPIEPYALGALIGDGSFRMGTTTFTSGDPEMFELLADSLPDFNLKMYRDVACYISDPESSHRTQSRLTDDLRALGLWGHRSESKFIPELYLKASIADRIELLRGLMDTDGGMEKMRSTFCTASEKLATDVQSLVESLGGTAKISRKENAFLGAYIVNVRIPNVCPFRLKRKADAWNDSRPSQHVMVGQRKIVSIEPDGVEPAQCITVDAEDNLYVTERFIVTHNSIFIQNLALSIASGLPFLKKFPIANDNITPGHRVLLLDRELSERSLFDRLDTLIVNIPGLKLAEDKLRVDHPFSLILDQEGAGESLVNLIRANNAEVVILDTAYKFFQGDIERSSGLRKAFETLDYVIRETGVSVIMTHHQKKGSNTAAGPDIDSVVGSFLWTGWVNGTVLLNFKNRSVKDPFTTIASFAGFRDSAPPDPLLLGRGKESLAYTSIQPYSFDDDDDLSDNPWQGGKKEHLNYDNVGNALLAACPVEQSEFLHAASALFGCRPDSVMPYLLDIMDRNPDFIREGSGSRQSPYVWRYVYTPEEEAYEQGTLTP